MRMALPISENHYLCIGLPSPHTPNLIPIPPPPPPPHTQPPTPTHPILSPHPHTHEHTQPPTHSHKYTKHTHRLHSHPPRPLLSIIRRRVIARASSLGRRGFFTAALSAARRSKASCVCVCSCESMIMCVCFIVRLCVCVCVCVCLCACVCACVCTLKCVSVHIKQNVGWMNKTLRVDYLRWSAIHGLQKKSVWGCPALSCTTKINVIITTSCI